VGQTAFAGDQADAVKKAVIGPQQAGWERHDYKAYMAQWTDDAEFVLGRAETPGKYDITFSRKQLEGTRKILMHGKPPGDRKLTFENVQVKIDGDRAELRCRTTMTFEGGFETVGEIYRLRKTSAGWKVYFNRGWSLEAKRDGQVLKFDAASYKKLDAAAEEQLGNDDRGAKAAQALYHAQRYAEEHALRKKITARKDATASDWLSRGYAALSIGDAEDALAAFRQALKLDASIPVPEYVRENPKK
jgi:tetratricopeptide (TPR) repeat protein